MRIEMLPASAYDDAVALWHAAGLTRPWNDPVEDLHRAMAGPASTVLACLDGERLVGTAMVGHDGHRGWLYYVAVAEPDRRRGVGRELMQACEQWVAERGIQKLQLMVRTTNESVVGFYEVLGYAPVDVVVLGRVLT